MKHGLFMVDGRSTIFNDKFESRYTNIGFRLAYFLWNMRGSNQLEELNFYSSHVNDMTDDHLTLRGAYGPRLRYWVGADQLQKCINDNIDVDNKEDFKKPEGVDQIKKVYEDLKSGILTSCCQIFDPSIDYEDTNYIPSLSNVIFFVKGSELHMMCNYLDFNFSSHTVNDVWFIRLIHICLCNMLNKTPGMIAFNTPTFENDNVIGALNKKIDSQYKELLPVNTSPEQMMKDIHNVCYFERHYRNAINYSSVQHADVDIKVLSEDRIEKFLKPLSEANPEGIESPFWTEMGLTLASFILIRCSADGYLDYIEEKILPRMSSKFKSSVERMIQDARIDGQ